MIRTVRKYDHWFTPKMWGFNFGRRIKRTVKFDKSCVYTFLNEDQLDWNKLFGVSYLTGVHRHSYRFGWRYNPLTNLIELSAYYYQNGIRQVKELGEVGFDREYELIIEQKKDKVIFVVNGQIEAILTGKLPLIGWKLGPYFGGNRPAPKQMKLYA